MFSLPAQHPNFVISFVFKIIHENNLKHDNIHEK